MTFAWVKTSDGRSVFRNTEPRPRGPRSALPCPMLIRDFDEPVQSMANGKWYTSKRGLAASHRASGNPQGVDYVEMGNEKPKAAPRTYDRKKLRDDIRAAKADLAAGWKPDVVALDD